MPIYEFRCNKCGAEFEQIVRSSTDTEGIPCPSCGKTDTCRLMSSFSCAPASSGSSSSKSSSCSGGHKGFS